MFSNIIVLVMPIPSVAGASLRRVFSSGACHGALRGLCGLDRAGIGHDSNAFEQDVLTIGSLKLHFFKSAYTNTLLVCIIK